jgi:hypothetical protein
VLTFSELLLKEFEAAIPRWGKQWTRQQREKALERCKDWKRADLPRFLKLGLPEWAEAQARERQGRGRGVVAPVTSLDEYALSGLSGLKAIFDPNTPPQVRKKLYRKSRWFPEFVEQAYRGERQRIQNGSFNRNEPHRTASDIAEERVSEAAGISSAQVRKLCHRVRKDCQGYSSSPPTSAADLKMHLEFGPASVRVKKLVRDLI